MCVFVYGPRPVVSGRMILPQSHTNTEARRTVCGPPAFCGGRQPTQFPSGSTIVCAEESASPSINTCRGDSGHDSMN